MADVPLMSNPMTTAGDIIYGGASGAPSRLGIGTAGQVLKVNSGATAVEWDDEAGGSAPTITPHALVPDNGGAVVQITDVAANGRGIIVPATVPPHLIGAEITGIRLRVGNAAGNVIVALYDASLGQLATSGSVSCPSSGNATVSFTSPYTFSAAGRYWFGLSSSTTSATFAMVNSSGTSTPLEALHNGTGGMPDPFVSSGVSRHPTLIGIVTGGSQT